LVMRTNMTTAKAIWNIIIFFGVGGLAGVRYYK